MSITVNRSQASRVKQLLWIGVRKVTINHNRNDSRFPQFDLQ